MLLLRRPCELRSTDDGDERSSQKFIVKCYVDFGGLDWRGWVRAALRALALRGARGGVRGVTGSKGRW